MGEGKPPSTPIHPYTHTPTLPLAACTLVLVLAAAVCAAPARPPAVWSVAFSPDGRFLASGSYRALSVWELAAVANGARAPVRQFSGLAGSVRGLAWSPDGKWLAAGGGRPAEFGEVRVWSAADLTASAPAGFVVRPHHDDVESVAFSPSGNLLLSASDDEKVVATDLRTHQPARVLADHTNRVTAVAASPDRRWIATGSLDKTVKIWDAADLKAVANVDVGGGPIYSVAFAGGGNQLLIGGEDNQVRLFRLEENRTGRIAGLRGTQARAFGGNRDPTYAVAAAARGPLGAYGGLECAVHVVDLGSGAAKFTLKDCADAVYALAFSPDGTLLAAGSRDGKARLWSMADGKLLAEL